MVELEAPSNIFEICLDPGNWEVHAQTSKGIFKMSTQIQVGTNKLIFDISKKEEKE
jgi:hypothetical protein